MRKSRLALGIFIFVAVVVVVIAIGFVSLLGENNKIDELTQAFFQEIRGGGFGEVLSGVKVKAPGPAEGLSDSLFLLELSLLKRYDLLGNDAYEVITWKSHFWIPFIDDNPVEVAVCLRKKPDSKSLKAALSSFSRLWSTGKDVDSIEHLLTVGRRNGNWVVESVNVSGSGIEKTYDDMRRRFRLHQYMTEAGHGFIMHEFAVNPDSLDPVEKRLLLHVFQEAQMELEGGRPPAPSAALAPGLHLR